MLRFGVLGSLLVLSDTGREIKITGPVRPRLLARFLLTPNQRISKDSLFEDIWSGSGHPHKVESNVSGLRTVLGEGDREIGRLLLPESHGGYMARLETDQLDSLQFEHRMEVARRARDETSLGEARESLMSALDCWRGRFVLDGLDLGSWDSAAAMYRESLEVQRVTAVHWLLEVLLALGQHEEALPLARAEVSTERGRFDEHLWYQLVLALYRSSSSSEALRAYDEIRGDLAIEKGLLPGSELAGLEKRMFMQDPSLDPPRRRLGEASLGPTDNLPTEIGDLVGRVEEAAHLRKQADTNRLVTVVGPAGAGKTRLATHVARAIHDDTLVVSCFVDLGSLSDPSLVLPTFAHALGFRLQSEEITIEGLCELLGEQPVLIVVDNCEHLVAEVALVVERVLRGAPRARVLATSREALRVRDECIERLGAMSTPSSSLADDDVDIWAFDAVRLFEKRASQVEASLDLKIWAREVRQIVTALEGLPLAIELAAARLDTMTPEEIATRLEDGFALLVGGSRTASPRQRSLEAAIDWSYRLLDGEEAAVLRLSSIFMGSFGIDALGSVSTEANLGPHHAEAAVRGLSSKSLVMAVKQVGMPSRYRLLDTIRRFGLDRLDESGPAELIRARRAHAEYFLGLARRARSGLNGPTQAQWLDRLTEELPDVRRALEQLRDDGRNDDAGELFGALGRYWFLRAQSIEALSLAETIIAEETDNPSLGNVVGLLGGAWATVYRKPQLALHWARLALGSSVALDDRSLECEAAAMVAAASFFAGEPDPDSGKRATEIAAGLENPQLSGLAAMCRGMALFATDIAGARQQFDEALEAVSVSGDSFVAYVALSDLGEVARSEGDFLTAEERFRAALDVRDELAYDDPMIVATLGLLLMAQRRFPEARQKLLDSVRSGRSYSYQQALLPLCGLATFAVTVERYDVAAEIYGFIDSLTSEHGGSGSSSESPDPDLEDLLPPDLIEERTSGLDAIARHLGDSDRERLSRAGRSRSWDEVIELIESLPDGRQLR